ncbi:MAG: cysteine--tRNA ligase [Candidatus Saccharimonadales bacterium]
MIRLYNTLSKSLENLTTINEHTVTIYSCGPTVYDYVHIGNLSSFVYADILHRVLDVSNYRVNHVMNFTDVDDKTIRRSREQYPELDARKALFTLTEKYQEIFLQDMVVIGNDITSIQFVKATDNISYMQALIRDLIDNKFAYIADDGIYFSIKAYTSSGCTYGQLVTLGQQSNSQQRIKNDEYDKDTAHDFALWKTQKDHEPAWDFDIQSQNMKGRPGWHIECSVMSTRNLGQPFDIHTGGIDLAFPHHENEIAQSTAHVENKTYSTLFFHNEHLLVDGKKMSKSLQNFYSLQDIMNKNFRPHDFRLLTLQSHYRTQSNFTWDNLSAAHSRMLSFEATTDLLFQTNNSVETLKDSVFSSCRENILTALSDDLNTSEALGHFSKLCSLIEKNEVINNNDVQNLNLLLEFVDRVFGFNLSLRNDITVEQKQLLLERQEAREKSDWLLSDTIRAKLLTQEIGIKDTPYGQIWYRTH